MPPTDIDDESLRLALDNYPTDPPRTDEEKDLVIFTTLNAGRYLARFRSLKERRLTFNVAVFFLGPLWLAYRKLYEWLVVWLVASIGFEYVANFFIRKYSFDHLTTLVWLASITLAILWGLLGYPIYFGRLQRVRRLADKLNLADEARTNFLRRHGGVSTLALTILIAALVGYAFIPSTRG
jgi:hypothetical protein